MEVELIKAYDSLTDLSCQTEDERLKSGNLTAEASTDDEDR